MEQDKRDGIVRSAAKIFSRFGFKKASVDEIAKDAGVAKGTVYLACESKDDLFYQAVHRELRTWTHETANLIDHRKPADELLGTAVVAGLAYLDAHPLVHQLYMRQHEAILPKWMQRFDELRALGRQNVVELLKLGQRQGRFRADLDIDATAELLQDLNMSTFMLHQKRSNDDERKAWLERRAKAGLDLVLYGLRTRTSS